MIASAYAHKNAATWLLVKGKQDLVTGAHGVSETIGDPLVPAMEAIGDTGDIITGLLAAFTGLGKDPLTACIQAASVSRLAGKIAAPDPGSQVMEIINCIPAALKQIFG